MSHVAQYYDDFSAKQIEMGINARNLSIQRWLEEYGLKPHHTVLEIGCGIGTQTQLLAEYLDSNTKIVANDISPKSIDIAKQRLAKHTNITFIADDIIKYPIKEQFDVVLLPDVIEHIPIEQHSELFKKISQCLKPTGFVLIHIPNPQFLEWCHINMKDKLQVIDQPVFTDILIKNTYPHGFYLHTLRTYSIWVDNGDYQIIVLKPQAPLAKREFTVIQPKVTFLDRVKHKVKRMIGK